MGKNVIREMLAKLYLIFFFVCQSSEVACDDDIQVQYGSDLQKAALDVHNFHRLNGGLPEMKIDKNAVEIAKKWMTESGKTCVMAHSPASYRHKDVDGKDMYFGENVFATSLYANDEPWNYTRIAEIACESWYAEIGFPDNGKNNTHNGLPNFQYDNFFEFCRNEPGNWISCNEELNNSCHLYNRMGPSRKSSASAVVPMGFMFFIDVLCVIITVKILFT